MRRTNLMIDEGYTKFHVDWIDRTPVDHPAVTELERWRRPLFAAGLVGHYAELSVGYGNISVRVDGPGLFVISGTGTGHLPHTGKDHYALVTRADIDRNSISCTGATQASSETLTHAALYELDLSVGAVVHVHSAVLWERLKHKAPTTGADAAYGTPEMAREFTRLYRDTSLPDTGIAVMAGHESGLVSIGSDLEGAARRILALHAESERDTGRH
jgi:ribulose-5-phosphate 4-epimerase/fuculose-1-phosphate aldolase